MRRSVVLSALVLALVGGLLTSPVSAGDAPGGAPGTASAPSDGASAAASASAVPEALLGNVRSVAVGYYHSCAILLNRQVRCWGANSYGESGSGNPADELPTAVVTKNANGTGPLKNVLQLALGDYHTCALLTNRQVRCWGGGVQGQLGTGNDDDAPFPRVVKNGAGTGPLVDVRSIAATEDGTCAVLRNGRVRCWGDDDYGQLGNGLPRMGSDLPVLVKGLNGNGVLTGIRSIDGGTDSLCVVTSGGQVRCWGRQREGVLGNGSGVDSPVPVRVRNANGTPLAGVAQVSQSGYHACARLSDGRAKCWGNNTAGNLGTGGTADQPRAVLVRRAGGGSLTGVRSVAAGGNSSCAVVAGGQVRCWGTDEVGQNGDGTFNNPNPRTLPAPVVNTSGSANLAGVRQLAGASYHYCVAQNTDRARCWGWNEHYGLGNGTTTDSPKPVLVQV